MFRPQLMAFMMKKDKADITPGKLAERCRDLMQRRHESKSLVFDGPCQSSLRTEREHVSDDVPLREGVEAEHQAEHEDKLEANILSVGRRAA